jgi:Tfp pilus assembly protein PilO
MTLAVREKKLITLAMASAVAFALLNWFVLPWTDQLMDSGDQLRLAEKKLRQEKELLAAGPQITAQTQALQSRLDTEEKRLLPTVDASQAGAQLQSWLVQRAGELQVDVQRSDFIAASPVSEKYVRVPVRMDLNGPITQVVQFMNAVTHSDRLVSVDELQISSFGVEKEKRVRCTLVISGLMAKGA